MHSPFSEIPLSEWVASNTFAFAIRDQFPVSPGHTLIIPHRVIATWFDACPDEQCGVLELIGEVKAQLDRELHPDGYNVGFNVGEAAGQTVMHLHVHVIPRFAGDMPDPRGGVRHVIPWRGNYKRSPVQPLATGGVDDPFARHLAPLFARADKVAIIAAFVQDSGLDLLREPLFSTVERGGSVRLVTGDYLAITQATALERLLDWQGACARTSDSPGSFEARIVETASLPAPTRSFHPKSWRFEGPELATAYVGSSNVSRSALEAGIEWNLRVDRASDPTAFDRIASEFERVWTRARPLTFDWVRAYSERARATAAPLPSGDAEPEPLAPAPPPHEVQVKALAALAACREEQRQRALVVMATGLGKTLLAALDAAAYLEQCGSPRPRILILAHRRELLIQAAETFRRVLRPKFPSLSVGWFFEERTELEADLVVASVQKLSRAEHLPRLDGITFDYVVVDEVHHADAASYRMVLDRIHAGFMLGLTATPDRADQGDVLGLFDDNLAFRADLDVGIESGRLVPFAYFGLKDVVDYANIPWRNRRFDPEVLARAVETEERMRQLWEAWQEHPGTRTLVFCCSVSHADFVSQWLGNRGVRAAAVYSAPGSADRSESLRAIAAGELDALCAVDLFNEGVDLPLVDRVVMLRPTESPVLFLQQLGRGLRRADGKEKLTVVDFVGNHRVFLDRVRTLLSFGSKTQSVRAFLQTGTATDLPPGCSVEVELEAIDLLRRLLPAGGSQVEAAYRELASSREDRPTAGELYRLGYNPSALRAAHGSWLEFVREEHGLDEAEQRVVDEAVDWFRDLETQAMTKSFKMVLLEALLESGAVGTGIPLEELAARSHAILVRSPELFRDIEGVQALADPRSPDPAKWLQYWRVNPVDHWCGSKKGGRAWFEVDGGRFVSHLPVPPGLEDVFVALTRELVDYRLAQYRQRQALALTGGSFDCKVIWNKRDPILKLPSRKANGDLPRGELEVRLADGSPWRFRMMAEFCNVARPYASQRNELPDLLRRWFGPAAGQPGTSFYVHFTRSPDAWWVEPRGRVVELPPRGKVTAFPTLKAAAGAVGGPIEKAPEAESVVLPLRTRSPDAFAVRAAGDSMAGGHEPIRDGDWLLFEYTRGVGLGAVEGRVALVQTDEDGGYGYQVKRVVRQNGRWVLRSDNPERPSYEASERTVPIARLIEKVAPESLGPEVGARLRDEEAAGAFGLTGELRQGRVGGHLFFLIEEHGRLVAPDRVRAAVADRRPAETAFVLARVQDGDPWRYCGVGRWLDAEGLWEIPAVDYATWRGLGEGREVSRRLPAALLERARVLASGVVDTVGGRFIGGDGRRCRVLGLAPQGGVRIDGGDDGFSARTVSLADLAWVIAATDDAAENGGTVDEARVNRLRYLEGTPRSSTRWIDTGWALMLSRAAHPTPGSQTT